MTTDGHDPGGHAPGGHDPGAQDPGGRDPDGRDPDGHAPGGHDPGAQDPGGHAPDGRDPDGRDPGGYDPEGLRVRREVLGDAHVDASLAAADQFTGDFQRFVTHYAWGGVWRRPGLDRRERSMLTLTALAALRAEGELALHLRAALRNGLTPDEIREVLLHVAVYAGVPAANSAFAVAARVLREEGALPPATDRESPPGPEPDGAGAG